jgi:L-iditol 2-dehydrogenase
MAEWIRVPAVNARHDSFPVNDLAVDRAVFIEPLGCSLKALRRVSCLRGASGAVVGCGVMGLLNLAAARALGAGRLVAVEPDPDRRRLAQSYGANEAISPEDAARDVAQALDFVIIGPGYAEVIRQSLRYLRPGGTAVLFTPTSTGLTTALDLGDLYFREIRLVPSYSCGPEDTHQAYELLRGDRIRPETMVTHRFALADAQQAFETARVGGKVLKVLVTLPDEKRT